MTSRKSAISSPDRQRPDAAHTLVNIQQLRAFAAYLVVLVHLDRLVAPLGIDKSLLSGAAAGVDIFFVISGFIMVHTTRNAPQDGLRFLAARARRVLPLYWILTIAVCIVGFLQPAVLIATRITLEHVAKSLAFIPYVRADGTIRPVLFLGWSLNYEVFFYLLFGAAMALRTKAQSLALVAFVLIALIGVGQFVTPTMPVLWFYTRPIIVEFVLGMVLAIGFAHVRPFAGMRVLGAAGLIGGISTFFLTVGQMPGLAHQAATALAASAVVGGALLLEIDGAVLRWRPGLTMGAASYSLYLSHPFVTQSVIGITDWFQVSSPIMCLAAALIALILATIFALAVFRFIEGPASRWAGRLGRTRVTG